MRKLWTPTVANAALALTVAAATACGGSGTPGAEGIQGAGGVAQGSSGDYCVVLKESMLRFIDLMPSVITGDSAALDEYVATIDKVRGVAPTEIRGNFDVLYAYYTQPYDHPEFDSLPPDLVSENLFAHAAQHCGKDFWNFMS